MLFLLLPQTEPSEPWRAASRWLCQCVPVPFSAAEIKYPDQSNLEEKELFVLFSP